MRSRPRSGSGPIGTGCADATLPSLAQVTEWTMKVPLVAKPAVQERTPERRASG